MTLKELLFGYYGTQCLYAVVQWSIADHLEGGPKAITELAQLAKVECDKLYRIMRFLAAHGIFQELPSAIFSLNSESSSLLTHTAGSLKEFITLHGLYFYPAAAHIADSLQTEATPFEQHFAMSAGKYFMEDAEASAVYNQAMLASSEAMSKKIVSAYNFSSYKMIIDVGGGIGSLLAAILSANPTVQGINFDLPALQKQAENYFTAKAITARCQYVGGSFYENIPVGGDLYLLKAIIHGKNDEQAQIILTRCRDALPPHGKLLIIERIMSPGENYIDACVNDINMLNVSRGKERTLPEFEMLLQRVKLSLTQIVPIEKSLVMIEAVLSTQ